MVNRDAIIAFVNRTREPSHASKRRYWVEQFRSLGPEATLRAGQALWEYVRRVRPDWPSDRDRADDLEHHIQLKRRLDRAAHAFRRR